MPHDPKVTVWIPSYNHARFLPQALDSVLAQTYTDFEVVVVDDGSADDSLAVAESYAARHPEKVRVFTHPGRRNRGISETVNLCFEKSRGLYVSGLPSDDVLRPEKLEAQVAFLERNPALGWVYGPVECLNESGEPWGEMARLGRDVTLDPDPVESLILENVVPGMSVLMRRSCVERVGPHDPSLVSSDWDFWVRMMAHAPAGFIDAPLVRHRMHTYNTSVGIDAAVRLKRCVEVMRSLRLKADSAGGALARPRTRALLDLQTAFFSYHAGDDAQAARALGAAFETDPTLRDSPAHFAGWLKDRTREQVEPARPEGSGRDFSSWVLRSLPAGLGDGFLRRAAAVDFACAALESYVADPSRARRMALECVRRDPRWLGDAPLRSVLARSMMGGGLLGRLRRLKSAAKGAQSARVAERNTPRD